MSEIKIKNLEMIQSIISRMANNSFLLKGWGITIISGIFSLNHEEMSFAIFLLIYLIIILFWILDSYYLQLERRFRVLYDDCVKSEEINFSMKLAEPTDENNTTFGQAFLSKTEMGFYLLLAIIISIVFINI